MDYDKLYNCLPISRSKLYDTKYTNNIRLFIEKIENVIGEKAKPKAPIKIKATTEIASNEIV